MYQIHIEDSGESFACPPTQTVLLAMATLGKRCIPVGCRQGGCGLCKVQIVAGDYRKRVMSRAQVSVADEAEHRVLACCIWPQSDLRLRVLGNKPSATTRPTSRALATNAGGRGSTASDGGSGDDCAPELG